MSGPVAGIDIGSHTVKLLLADADREERHIVTTRLGSGVDERRAFDTAALDRAAATFRALRVRIDAAGAPQVRAVATSAVRDAGNRDELLDLAERELGVRPSVLSGEEEARLSFLGATRRLATEPGTTAVLDIGGGSTELVVWRGGRPVGRSIDVGAARLTEQWLHHDPPAPDELTNAIGSVHDELENVLRDLPELGAAEVLVGVGGTIVTVEAVELGAPAGEIDVLDGRSLSRDAAEDVFRTLATERLADRIHNPGLPRDRAGIIVGGCCVLVAVLRRLRVPVLHVTVRGVVDAVVDELRAER